MDAKFADFYPPGQVEPGMNRLQLAHAYVPYQQYRNAYSPAEALRKGTLYPELWMPYRPEEERSDRGYY